jgi:hypothetical protein
LVQRNQGPIQNQLDLDFKSCDKEIQNMGKFKTNEILKKYKMATKTKAKVNIPLYHMIFMHAFYPTLNTIVLG